MKPEAVAGFQAGVSRAIARGDRIAILSQGEIHGVLWILHPVSGTEFTIDSSFFSSGTEAEKETDTRTLAREINLSRR